MGRNEQLKCLFKRLAERNKMIKNLKQKLSVNVYKGIQLLLVMAYLQVLQVFRLRKHDSKWQEIRRG